MNKSQYRSLSKRGFVKINNFINENDYPLNLSSSLIKKKNKFNGVIENIPHKHIIKIQKKIKSLVIKLNQYGKFKLDTKNFNYAAIYVNPKKNVTKLNKPFDVNRDPKSNSNGSLNWHLDHYSYYFYRNHKNYLIMYLPILKKNINFSNLGIIPLDILKKKDIKTFKRTKNRGALRFRQVEADTITWFEQRFKSKIKVGEWYAIDDYYENAGWKIKLNLEKNKVVPKLRKNDLLIMRADVIHKTNDAKIKRLSIRCDAIPKNYIVPSSWLGFWKFFILFPFLKPKVKYNMKKYIGEFLIRKINTFKRIILT